MRYFALAAVAALILIGCSEPASRSASAPAGTSGAAVLRASTLDRVLERGVLRVGTPGDFRPMTFRNPDTGEYEGYYIDVAKDLAADMGVEIEWVATTWRDIVAGIAADRYDLATGASYNMGRATQGAFTLPIAQVGTVPLVLRGRSAEFSGWESINQPGVRVAVTLGTVFDEQARRYFPNAQIIAVESPARDFQEVLSARADISITSTIEAASLIQTYPELVAVPVDRPRDQNANGMIVPRDDHTFLQYVNTWIVMKQYAGYFEMLAQRWGLSL